MGVPLSGPALRESKPPLWCVPHTLNIRHQLFALPYLLPGIVAGGQTGACQRLPAFSLALSVSLSRRPPWAASDCMFAAAPSAAAARRAGVSGAPVLPWALLKTSLSVLRRFAGAGALGAEWPCDLPAVNSRIYFIFLEKNHLLLVNLKVATTNKLIT